MSLAIPVHEARDKYPVINPESGEVLLWADFEEAQALIKAETVEPIRRKNRIRCLAVKPQKKVPQKPTPIRQHGTMGDSHTQLRECRCKDCRECGQPIPEHENRSTNPAGVWTIDQLPRWGKGGWKTRAMFRRPLLECMYGKKRVDECLSNTARNSSPLPSKKSRSNSKAA